MKQKLAKQRNVETRSQLALSRDNEQPELRHRVVTNRSSFDREDDNDDELAIRDRTIEDKIAPILVNTARLMRQQEEGGDTAGDRYYSNERQNEDKPRQQQQQQQQGDEISQLSAGSLDDVYGNREEVSTTRKLKKIVNKNTSKFLPMDAFEYF